MKNKIAVNTTMLYFMNIAKLIFPFLTLPYLTRVLSVDNYAMVSYVKSTMQYMQLIVDFGFLLSASSAIVLAGEDKKKIGSIVSNTIFAKLILTFFSFLALIALSFSIPLLRQNLLFVFLSFITVALSSFLVDYLFRGLEQMQEITFRFVLMKGISTALTFVFVHSDKDILWIPILDVLGTLVSLILVWARVKKYQLPFALPNLKEAWSQLKISFTYFLSDIATTAFGALNTLLIGILLPTAQVALWSVALQVISAVQVMYSPIINGIHPEMVRSKSARLLKKTALIFMPIVLVGSVALFFLSDTAILIIGGAKYLEASPVLRVLIPILVFSFPAQLIGWPGLGALGKIKETTATTIFSAVFQCAGLGILIACGQFTIINLALLRGLTELMLLLSRLFFCWKNRKQFA